MTTVIEQLRVLIEQLRDIATGRDSYDSDDEWQEHLLAQLEEVDRSLDGQNVETTSTLLIIDADVVQRVVDEDMAGITVHAKLDGTGIVLDAYSGEDELVASNHVDLRNAGCDKCGMNDRADGSELCDACLDDATLSTDQLRSMLANHDEFELAIVGRKYAEIRTQLAEMGYPVDIQVVMAVVDQMASKDQYFVRLAQTVNR